MRGALRAIRTKACLPARSVRQREARARKRPHPFQQFPMPASLGLAFLFLLRLKQHRSHIAQPFFLG
jgi:hypothetical protein